MRKPSRLRLLVLSAAVVVAGSLPVTAQDCTWHQWDDGIGGWIGYWDCGSCTALYVWRPGWDDWVPAGSDCEAQLN